MERVFLVVACLVCVTSAWFFSGPDWNGLRVTFGINPFTSFNELPRTRNAAENEGWVKIADCDSNGKFRGFRYVKDNDYGVILMFDKNGYIAGIQCGIRTSEVTRDYPPRKQVGHMFQDDGDRLTITAYFTEPARICSTGRTADEFRKEGTGSRLYIQNGSDPITQSIRIPNNEANVDTGVWTKGFCFLGMGNHYWYSVSRDMNCDDFQPVFLLYNDDKLNAFGWALGMNRNSDRFEHPPRRHINKFMNPVPTCLSNYSMLSTMHIYMTDSPRMNWC